MAQLTFASGDVLTAAQLNTYCSHEGGAFTAWTPVVEQETDPITTSASRAVYGRAGRLVYGEASIVVISGSSGIKVIDVTLPVAAAGNTNTILGEGWVNDSSAGGYFYFGILMYQTSTTAVFLRRAEGASATYLGATGFAASLATDDVISMKFCYEALS